MDPALKTLAANVPVHVANKIAQLAAQSGRSTHAYMVELVTHHAASPDHSFLSASQAREPKLPATIAVEITVPMCQRLHATARQMREPSGAQTTPSSLARMLLVHECEETTDIIERLAMCDESYVDHAWQAKTYTRAYREWHLLVIRCSNETRNAVFAAAKEREQSVTDMVRDILNERLPQYPYIGRR